VRDVVLLFVKKYRNPNAHTPALNTPIFTFLPQQRNPERFAKKKTNKELLT
jgi:hypothetical protein